MSETAVSPDLMANAIRVLSADAVQAAKSGHPGMPMGMADVATVLFTDFLKFDPQDAEWPDRDRFVLSAGHGSMLLYSLLYLTGYPDMTLEQIKNFRQLGAITAGHPEYGHAKGIETTTGPLGQGLGNAVGMALAEKILAARYGAEAVDHFTYVIAGDGCLMEGISHEALSLAGHLQLSKLIVLWDDNGITIDGKTKIAVSDDVLGRFTALGWDVQSCDGHDRKAVAGCIAAAQKTGTPSLIACKTAIGKGAPTMVGTAKVHGSPLGDEEIAGMRAKLDWPEERFALPDGVLEAWRAVGAKGAAARKAWGQRLGQMAEQDRTALLESLAGSVGPAVIDALNAHKAKLAEDKPTQATRVASQKALEAFFPAVPSLLGGSADLTGSNNTKPAGEVGIVSADDASGRYIHYGVREHGMAAAMNGLALHGGFIPYGGTFLVFTDYLRPSLRMAALMETRVIYVMTHDSIGLGEDGPTHQPVEHLASLRAMPGVQVFRPADAVETAECWAAAMLTPDQPSVLALTRQGLPTLRTEYREDNPCAEGGYVLAEAEGGADARKATIIASGSEVEIAMAARDALAEKDIPVAVVSLPCWERFSAQPAEKIEQVLGPRATRVSVEAASVFGWERWVEPGAAVGMDSFGASGPYKELYKHFGITAEAVVERVEAQIAAAS